MMKPLSERVQAALGDVDRVADLIEAAQSVAESSYRWPDSLWDAPKYLIDADILLRLRDAVDALGGDELGEEQKE